MARVLITGHDGFTGKYIWSALKAQGDIPVSLTDNMGAIDLRDGERVNDAVSRLKPDQIIHLAAISSVTHQNVKEIYDVNLIGTRNLLEATLHSEKDLERIIIASSANIYGNQSGKLDELREIQPVNDYAVSKASVELLARSYQSKIPIIITRPFNYTGIGQSTNFLVAKIIHHLKFSILDIELGNIDISRDFSDVRDIARYYVELLKFKEAVGQTINLCSGNSTSLKDIIKISEEMSGKKLKIKQNKSLIRENDIINLYGDSQKLRNIIKNNDFIKISETIKWMLGG